mmetsp:Transcript_44346/g.117160  ORF Transcript_44346/g.117160 Transcript_44346/m.117160 type:complete len:167 (-) Transcript_44346:45-545(-)
MLWGTTRRGFFRHAMARSMKVAPREAMRRAFAAIDHNDSGSISEAEFTWWITKHNVHTMEICGRTPEQVFRLFLPEGASELILEDWMTEDDPAATEKVLAVEARREERLKLEAQRHPVGGLEEEDRGSESAGAMSESECSDHSADVDQYLVKQMQLLRKQDLGYGG